MQITIRDLTKDYGKFRALNGVHLSIDGGMFGLLGPNGAGKSTLMRILTTLIPLTSGTVEIGGHDVMRNPGEIRRQLGYMPQDFGFYKGLNAYELLDYIATMKNLPRAGRPDKIQRVLEEVNLTAAAKRRVGGYSGGMRQRLGIAQALLGDPQLLIVDEPTAGLDPEERIRFRNLLARLAGNRTVILSTHIVGDIEASCTGVAVLSRGRVAFVGTTEALAAQASGRVWELDIHPTEWDQIESRYRVVSSRAAGGRLYVRVLAAENPDGRGVPAPSGIEEGYISVMNSGGTTSPFLVAPMKTMEVSHA